MPYIATVQLEIEDHEMTEAFALYAKEHNGRRAPSLAAALACDIQAHLYDEGGFHGCFEVLGVKPFAYPPQPTKAPQFDNTQAALEGWSVSEVGAVGDAFRLEKLDERNKFGTDQQAWVFVYLSAKSGSVYHAAALAYLETHAPEEHTLILNHITLHNLA